MTKPIIDDAMVKRATEAFRWPREYDAAWSAEILAREMLTAALTHATPEPEIPVSEEMYEAANAEWARLAGWSSSESFRSTHGDKIIAACFRAMESVRRKAEKPATSPLSLDGMDSLLRFSGPSAVSSKAENPICEHDWWQSGHMDHNGSRYSNTYCCSKCGVRRTEYVRPKAEKTDLPGGVYSDGIRYREHYRKGENCDHTHRRSTDSK